MWLLVFLFLPHPVLLLKGHCEKICIVSVYKDHKPVALYSHTGISIGNPFISRPNGDWEFGVMTPGSYEVVTR